MISEQRYNESKNMAQALGDMKRFIGFIGVSLVTVAAVKTGYGTATHHELSPAIGDFSSLGFGTMAVAATFSRLQNHFDTIRFEYEQRADLEAL